MFVSEVGKVGVVPSLPVCLQVRCPCVFFVQFEENRVMCITRAIYHNFYGYCTGIFAKNVKACQRVQHPGLKAFACFNFVFDSSIKFEIPENITDYDSSKVDQRLYGLGDVVASRRAVYAFPSANRSVASRCRSLKQGATVMTDDGSPIPSKRNLCVERHDLMNLVVEGWLGDVVSLGLITPR